MDLSQTEIFSRSDLEVPVVKTFAHGELVIYSRRCPGSDVVSEDSAAVIPLSEPGEYLVSEEELGSVFIDVGPESVRRRV